MICGETYQIRTKICFGRSDFDCSIVSGFTNFKVPTQLQDKRTILLNGVIKIDKNELIKIRFLIVGFDI